MLVSANGQIIKSEINGTMKMISQLSGMPELKLGLNDKLVYDVSEKSSNRNIEM